MKKLYILLFIWLPAMSHGQNYLYSPSQVLDTDLMTNEYNFAQIDMWTPDSTGITFGWEAIENTIPVEWTYSLCDYTNCYSGIPANGTMTPISTASMQAGTKGFLKITVDPADVSGTAVVRFKIFNTGDVSAADTITFNFNHVSTAGIASTENGTFDIYPNPANDVLNISNGFDTETSWSIVDMSGRVYESGVVSANSTSVLKVSDLSTGIYFVKYMGSDGNRRTEKLVIR